MDSRVKGGIHRAIFGGGRDLPGGIEANSSIVPRVRTAHSNFCRSVAPGPYGEHSTRHGFTRAIERPSRAGHVVDCVPLARSHSPRICSERGIRHGFVGGKRR
ncbi:hypothetical protein D3C87_844950 [compost metagenome]